MNKIGYEGNRNMKKFLKEVLSTSIYLLVVLMLTFLIVKYVAVRIEVNGPSMETTLYNQDNLIMQKFSYHFTDPERFDVIVFPFKHGERIYYIKRVIGLPGETIQIDSDGTIYINDEILEENYGKEVITNPGLASEPIHLRSNEYFVLGDNRNNSSDSRDPSVGNIYRDDIIGKAWFRIYPNFEVVK